MRCTYCGSEAHPMEYCPKTWEGQINRAGLKCSYCGSTKHNRDACPKCWPGPNPVKLKD